MSELWHYFTVGCLCVLAMLVVCALALGGMYLLDNFVVARIIGLTCFGLFLTFFLGFLVAGDW